MAGMKLYIVSVRHGDERYADSLWVIEQHAVDRLDDLAKSLQRAGKRVGMTEPWNVWITDATVNDAELS
jgi:hypothetical protein